MNKTSRKSCHTLSTWLQNSLNESFQYSVCDEIILYYVSKIDAVHIVITVVRN